MKAAFRQRRRNRHVMTTTLGSTSLTSGQMNPRERSTKVDLAGRPACVLRCVVRRTPLLIKCLNAAVSEATVCFSSPEVPRELPYSSDQHVAVPPTAQPAELLG